MGKNEKNNEVSWLELDSGGSGSEIIESQLNAKGPGIPKWLPQEDEKKSLVFYNVLILVKAFKRGDMKYYEEGELVDKSACAHQRADLKKCLLESDCVRKLRKTPRQCLKEPEGMVPAECFALRVAFFECKRSMLDMRVRFRGLKQ